MSITRYKRGYFFNQPAGSQYHLFSKGNTPDESAYKKLFNSVGFIGASEDFGSLTQAGFLKIESDAFVAARTDNMGSGAPYAVQPYQLPNLIDADDATIVSGGSISTKGGLKIEPISTAVGSKSKLDFKIEWWPAALDVDGNKSDPDNDSMFFSDASDGNKPKRYPIRSIIEKACRIKLSSPNLVPYDDAANYGLMNFTGLILKKGATRTITIDRGTTTGDALLILAGEAAAGTGGLMTVKGGSGATAGAGGELNLYGGTGHTTGAGGHLRIAGGDSPGGIGGDVYIDGGNGVTDGNIAIASSRGRVGIGGEADSTDMLKVSGSGLITGSLKIVTIANAGEDTDKFLCVDSNGTIKYVTGSELASYIA